MIAEVTQRIRIETDSYAEVGAVLDSIDKHTAAVLADRGLNGKCDFVSFNTHPCKAMAFDEPPMSQPMEQISNYHEGAM